MYRTEHPKPQFMRTTWENLNGSWDFEIDRGDSGISRKMQTAEGNYTRKIEVPFCPESRLSGIADTDFMAAVWYRRTISVTKEQLSGRVVLHIGACDYLTTLFVNGNECGRHKGGYVSFSFDITAALHEGENLLVIRAQDNTRDRLIPSGKQSDRYESYGCSYTRTTGIWQTVWLEFTPRNYIRNLRIEGDIDTVALTLKLDLCGVGDLSVKASFEGKPMGEITRKAASGQVIVTLPLAEKHLWDLGQGNLYDLELIFGGDRVQTYTGLRKIEYRDMKFFLNGRSVFQRLVLDQGFNPEGIYTAPSDEELRADVSRSMALGFNGARLHEKVFEERFLYHCDKAGYIVWGEYPNWGLDVTYADALNGILAEWLEEINRDINHPAIVGWCPLNETWDHCGRQQFNGNHELLYRATKAADPSRPCIDTSGNFHVITDIYDIHDYNQDPATFAKSFETLTENGTYNDRFAPRQVYRPGELFFVSEYGGIGWTKDSHGWGYGNIPVSEKAFLERLKGLTDALLDNPKIFAYCYTQLTDVEQEQNGLYTYDRHPKFDPAIISAIFGKKAAIED